MPSVATFLIPYVSPMGGGAADVAGRGETWQITYTGPAPTSGDTFSVQLVDSETAIVVQAGAGDTTKIVPSFCFSYRGKTYILAGQNVYFSAINEPIVFNDPDAVGNGFVELINQVVNPEDIAAGVPFQGNIAFYGRQSIQVWSTPSDPAQWQLVQTLENIGTIAKASVKAKGDLDNLFLSDTGIRSLRARETTLNAFVDDIGSPIDAIIQAVLLAHPSDAANACAVIEPSTNSYWLFLRDTIYVLSYYPSSKVIAWGTYVPGFNISKFVVFQGQVYAWVGNTIYQYGGANRNTYDASVVTIELPWLDLKSPGALKMAKEINVALTGAWTISLGMDPVSGTLESPVYQNNAPTYDLGKVALSGQGSHFTMKAVTTGATAALFSSLVFHYEDIGEV
jgi:hypothetical protein